VSFGYYILHRGWFDSPNFKQRTLCERAAWIWLIEHACWQPKKIRVSGKIMTLGRGQLSYSRRFLAKAMNRKTVKIGNDQSYEWGVVEAKFGKVRKYACVDYHWYGSQWLRVVEAMKKVGMRPSTIGFYKGAKIDETAMTVNIRGDFVRAVVADKHLFFWRSFFRCTDKQEPKILTAGKIVKLPNIAGDNDSLNFFVDGQNINEILSDPEDGEIAA
jgi:hypothetical protein